MSIILECYVMCYIKENKKNFSKSYCDSILIFQDNIIFIYIHTLSQSNYEYKFISHLKTLITAHY